jgi:deoxyribodipyrimidine photo-lyase
MQHHLVWFREDLRTIDHTALAAACLSEHPVTAVYQRTPETWASFDIGTNRLAYTEHLLSSLHHELNSLNIPLHVQTTTYDGAAEMLVDLCKTLGITHLHFNRQYEILERRRDQRVRALLTDQSVTCFEYEDLCLLPPGSVLTAQGTPYTVFSPFKKRWLETYRLTGAGPLAQPNPIPGIADLPALRPIPYTPESDIHCWAITENDALARLEAFCEKGLIQYDSQRNAPALPGTSQLSPYLARGLLSPRQCIAAAERALNRSIHEFPSESFGWINELIWRDFYKHLLVAFPRLSKNRAFRPETEKLAWRNDPKEIERFMSATTGIPIIDAGISELTSTGWMHNRVRMIVAQFLTKNLLVDWRIGEAFFMRYLLDSDLAANNGGWQWSASTGTDAAPYFRVFNPVSQSQAHDPDGIYLTRYLPVLSALPRKARHAPWMAPHGLDYPAPMVDLKATRQRAIDAFKGLSS